MEVKDGNLQRDQSFHQGQGYQGYQSDPKRVEEKETSLGCILQVNWGP